MSKKILITGASGFVGYHLIREALLQDFEVFAAVRKTSEVAHLADLPIRLVYPAFQNTDQLTRDLSLYGITHIVHAAAVTKAANQKEYDYANAILTRNLALAAGRADIALENFVFLSSLAAKGPSFNGQPITEETPPHPVTFYGKSKLLAENYLAEVDGIPLTGLRPTAVYGPREKDLFIVLKMIKQGWELYIGRLQQRLSFVYVQDLVNVVFRTLAGPGRGSYYNVSDGEGYDRYALAQITRSLLHKRTFRLHVPLGLVRAFLKIQNRLTPAAKASILNLDKLSELTASWECSIEKLRCELQYQPAYQLQEGLSQTIGWYQQNKWF